MTPTLGCLRWIPYSISLCWTWRTFPLIMDSCDSQCLECSRKSGLERSQVYSLILTWDSAPFQSSVASPSPDISSFKVLKYRRTDYFVCLDYCSVWLLPRKFRPFETWRALAAFPIWPTNTRAVITIQFRQKNMITFQAFCTSEGIHSLWSTSP